MIIIQRIETVWTKASRGMPGAAVRNAVPKKMPLPVESIKNAGIYVHEVKAQEDNNFVFQQQSYFLPDSDEYWSLSFQSEGSFVKAVFKYKYSEHGKPDRGRFKKTLFKLRVNETGVFCINGRFASYSGQHYTQHFVNIANTAEIYENIFIDKEPDYSVNMLADLF